MRKLFFLFLLSVFHDYCFCQVEKMKSKIGVSVPVVWNRSYGVYYSTGNRREPVGSAISNGVNISYSRFIHKNLFLVGGAGFYRQRFNIIRPFYYTPLFPVDPLYSTESYSYDNIYLIAGIGYEKQVMPSVAIRGVASYNWLYSFKQKYIVNKEYKTWQVNKTSNNIGSSINVNVGLTKRISRSLLVGMDMILPVYINWNNDKMFLKYDYATDTQIIAHNRFSIGTSLSFYYRLKY